MYILCVEDNVTQANWLTHVLRGQAHEVVVYENALDALRAAQEREPEVALIDYQLPGLSGIGMARHLRQMYPRCAIMLMSAHIQTNQVIDSFHAGVDDVLLKPFEAEQLFNRVWEAIAHRQTYLLPSLLEQQGPLRVDRTQQRVMWFGEVLDVTTMEYTLLSYLTYRVNQVVSFVDLYQVMTGATVSYAEARDLVRRHVSKLRRKLNDPRPDGRSYLISVRGQGFRWSPNGEWLSTEVAAHEGSEEKGSESAPGSGRVSLVC